jgi:protein O-mannosyl-transferase
LRLKPRDAGIHFNLGLALEKLGRVDEAITYFAEAVRIDPAAVEARYHLGRCLFLTGKIEPAAAQLSEVVRQKPDHAQAQFFLGLAQLNQGQTEGGIGHLREAIRLRPDLADPLNALAWELATDPNSQLRQGAEAVRLAEKAAELTQRQQPVILNTLAAAYAEAGRFDEAVATANQAMELARKAGQSNLVASIQSALDLYQSHQAFRQGAAP